MGLQPMAQQLALSNLETEQTIQGALAVATMAKHRYSQSHGVVASTYHL